MSSPPATVNIIRVVFEGIVSVIKVIRCKFSCSSCKSDCQQPAQEEEPSSPKKLEPIDEQKIMDFYRKIQED